MRCNLVFYPNSLQIHLDKELTKKPFEIFHSEECACSVDKNRPAYISNLFKLVGIIEIRINRHTIFIYKGWAFEWEEIIPNIMNNVLIGFDPLGELVQTKPAIEYFFEKYEDTDYRTRVKILPVSNPYRLPEKERKKK